MLITHVLFVAFVVIGLVAIYLGRLRSWRWVRNVRFRLLHLLAILLVVLQAWLGILCPLTIVEMRLRALAGAAVYEGAFVQHWLHAILYYDAPEWLFIAGYTVFGGMVLASWFIVPPVRDE